MIKAGDKAALFEAHSTQGAINMASMTGGWVGFILLSQRQHSRMHHSSYGLHSS